jgi:hypothetical protein
MYDFGFKPETLFGLALIEGYKHEIGDMYDRNHPTLGNSFIDGCDANNNIIYNYDGESELPDWLYLKDVNTDLRMFFVKCNSDGEVVPHHEWGECLVK